MGAAVSNGAWMQPCVSKPNRYYWCASFTAAAWNDTSITCKLPATLKLGGYARILYVSRVTLHIDAAAAGLVVGNPTVGTPATSYGAWLEPWTPAAKVDSNRWAVDVSFPVDVIDNSVWMPYFGNLTGYGALDSAYITISGWLEVSASEPLLPEIKPPSPTPVSLEGYKWPLVKRV